MITCNAVVELKNKLIDPVHHYVREYSKRYKPNNTEKIFVQVYLNKQVEIIKMLLCDDNIPLQDDLIFMMASHRIKDKRLYYPFAGTTTYFSQYYFDDVKDTVKIEIKDPDTNEIKYFKLDFKEFPQAS